MADGLLSIVSLERLDAIIETIGLILADTIIQSNTIITAEP
jgi:hypothetical protein